ncbi:hypothetical protein GQ568_00855 [Patescibacteria group bacterium]|nr:hypothetical protein [Patescibacteria group bacterium]
MSTPTQLEKQILATVVYYDILDYPLTSFEVFLYLVRSDKSEEDKKEPSPEVSELGSFLSLLNESEYLKKHISQELGFYFLKKRVLKSQKTPVGRLEPTEENRENAKRLHINTPPAPLKRGIGTMESADMNIVQQRLDRKKIWDRKWKKAKKIFWIMQIIPFTKLVMGSGSFSLGNTRKDSDVDLMIVARRGRIWTVRTFFTLLTSLLRVRRYKDKTEDMICLNHYITDRSLRIPFESLYTIQLYYHILSVYNSGEDRKLFKKFQEENKWMKKYLENYEFSNLEGLRSIKRSKILNSISKIFEFILFGRMGDYFEKKMSEIQTNRIKKDPLNSKKGGRITISDDQLEFHPNSQERKIIPEFNRRMKELGLSEFANQKDSGLNE